MSNLKIANCDEEELAAIVLARPVAALSASDITQILSRPLPPKILETKKLGGAKITFISWKYLPIILDKYCRGWCWEIRNIVTTDDRLFLVGRLTIPTADGIIFREATGTEMLKEYKTDRVTGEVIEREIAYGDPSSNAESMAFRRACSKFGLGLYLYGGK
jgi:hypothetical protein